MRRYMEVYRKVEKDRREVEEYREEDGY